MDFSQKLDEALNIDPIVKVLERDEESLTIVPGYCMRLSEMVNTYKDLAEGHDMATPFVGNLYVVDTPEDLMPLPFAGMDMVGWAGKPKVKYSKEEITAFIQSCNGSKTEDLFACLEKTSGEGRRGISVCHDIVRSIEPGVYNSGGGAGMKSEVIINVLAKLTLLAKPVGSSGTGYSFFSL